jgi:hypothetical protein
MRKVYVIGIAVFLSIVAIGYIVWYLQGLKEYNHKQFYQLVPKQASCVVVINDVQALIDKVDDCQLVSNAFTFVSPIETFKKGLFALDSLGLISEPVVNDIFKRSCCVVFSNMDDTLISSFYFEFTNRQSASHFLGFITDETSYVHHLALTNYRDYDIHEIEIKGLRGHLYVAVIDGVAVCSVFEKGVRTAIDIIEDPELGVSANEFNQLVKTTSSASLINLYVNFDREAELNSLIFSKVDSIGRPLSFKTFGNWFAADWDLSQTSLSLSGVFNSLNDSSLAKLLFEKSSPSIPKIQNQFPDGVNYYCHYNFSTPDDERYENLVTFYHRFNLNKNTESDSLLSLVTNEIALVSCKNFFNGDQDKYLIMSIKGEMQFQNSVAPFLALTSNDNKPLDVYEPTKEISIPIFKGFDNHQFSNQLSFLIPQVPDRFYTFYDNYVIFSDSINSLKNYLKKCLLKQFLVNTSDYAQFSKQLSSETNYRFFITPAYFPTAYKQGLRMDIQKYLNAESDNLNKFYGFGWQVLVDGNLTLGNSVITYQTSHQKEYVPLWQSRLDTCVIDEPFIAFKHNRLDYDILVQDKKFNLYLLDSDGIIRWKKRLSSKILGEIQVIKIGASSYYLFNDKSRIYVVDNDGNTFNGFPILLSSEATNQVSCFDYDNTKNYRFFIACADKSVQLFDIKGQPLKDWKTPKIEAVVSQPIQYFRVLDKDYLVIADTNRHYIIDRRGNERLRVTDDSKPSQRSIAKQLRSSRNNSLDMGFINSANQFSVLNIPSGRCISKPLPVELSEIVDFELINDNFLFWNEHELIMTDQQLAVVWRKTYKDEAIASVSKFNLSESDVKIGISLTSGKVDLLSEGGNSLINKGIDGISHFNIVSETLNSGQYNLFIGDKNSCLANYRIVAK